MAESPQRARDPRPRPKDRTKPVSQPKKKKKKKHLLLFRTWPKCIGSSHGFSVGRGRRERPPPRHRWRGRRRGRLLRVARWTSPVWPRRASAAPREWPCPLVTGGWVWGAGPRREGRPRVAGEHRGGRGERVRGCAWRVPGQPRGQGERMELPPTRAFLHARDDRGCSSPRLLPCRLSGLRTALPALSVAWRCM